jgi:hypothetical protein
MCIGVNTRVSKHSLNELAIEPIISVLLNKLMLLKVTLRGRFSYMPFPEFKYHHQG